MPPVQNNDDRPAELTPPHSVQRTARFVAEAGRAAAPTASFAPFSSPVLGRLGTLGRSVLQRWEGSPLVASTLLPFHGALAERARPGLDLPLSRPSMPIVSYLGAAPPQPEPAEPLPSGTEPALPMAQRPVARALQRPSPIPPATEPWPAAGVRPAPLLGSPEPPPESGDLPADRTPAAGQGSVAAFTQRLSEARRPPTITRAAVGSALRPVAPISHTPGTPPILQRFTAPGDTPGAVDGLSDGPARPELVFAASAVGEAPSPAPAAPPLLARRAITDGTGEAPESPARAVESLPPAVLPPPIPSPAPATILSRAPFRSITAPMPAETPVAGDVRPQATLAPQARGDAGEVPVRVFGEAFPGLAAPGLSPAPLSFPLPRIRAELLLSSVARTFSVAPSEGPAAPVGPARPLPPSLPVLSPWASAAPSLSRPELPRLALPSRAAAAETAAPEGNAIARTPRALPPLPREVPGFSAASAFHRLLLARVASPAEDAPERIPASPGEPPSRRADASIAPSGAMALRQAIAPAPAPPAVRRAAPLPISATGLRLARKALPDAGEPSEGQPSMGPSQSAAPVRSLFSSSRRGGMEAPASLPLVGFPQSRLSAAPEVGEQSGGDAAPRPEGFAPPVLPLLSFPNLRSGPGAAPDFSSPQPALSSRFLPTVAAPRPGPIAEAHALSLPSLLSRQSAPPDVPSPQPAPSRFSFSPSVAAAPGVERPETQERRDAAPGSAAFSTLSLPSFPSLLPLLSRRSSPPGVLPSVAAAGGGEGQEVEDVTPRSDPFAAPRSSPFPSIGRGGMEAPRALPLVSFPISASPHPERAAPLSPLPQARGGSRPILSRFMPGQESFRESRPLPAAGERMGQPAPQPHLPLLPFPSLPSRPPATSLSSTAFSTAPETGEQPEGDAAPRPEGFAPPVLPLLSFPNLRSRPEASPEVPSPQPVLSRFLPTVAARRPTPVAAAGLPLLSLPAPPSPPTDAVADRDTGQETGAAAGLTIPRALSLAALTARAPDGAESPRVAPRPTFPAPRTAITPRSAAPLPQPLLRRIASPPAEDGGGSAGGAEVALPAVDLAEDRSEQRAGATPILPLLPARASQPLSIAPFSPPPASRAAGLPDAMRTDAVRPFLPLFATEPIRDLAGAAGDTPAPAAPGVAAPLPARSPAPLIAAARALPTTTFAIADAPGMSAGEAPPAAPAPLPPAPHAMAERAPARPLTGARARSRPATAPSPVIQRAERGGESAPAAGKGEGAERGGGDRGPEQSDVHLLANEVWSLLKRRLQAEAERQGRL